MITINNLLYDYPVTITDEDFENATGTNLKNELGVTQDIEVQDWLNAAHENIYNKIYKIGGKTLKDSLINNYIAYLEKPLKRCLIVELKYMLGANGDYGVVDGSHVSADGQLVVVDKKQIIPKIVAPKVIEILKAAKPNLLLGDNEL